MICAMVEWMVRVEGVEELLEDDAVENAEVELKNEEQTGNDKGCVGAALCVELCPDVCCCDPVRD